MEWLRSHRQSGWIVGITLILPALLFLYALGSLLTARAQIQGQIDSLEPRVARIQGLALAQADLETALQSAGDNAGMVYAASQDQASVSEIGRAHV